MGAWSDYSDEMKALKPRKKWQFGIKIDNDGEFHMRMSDFVQVKTTMTHPFFIFKVLYSNANIGSQWIARAIM